LNVTHAKHAAGGCNGSSKRLSSAVTDVVLAAD
jgi:hypothetical protein